MNWIQNKQTFKTLKSVSMYYAWILGIEYDVEFDLNELNPEKINF